MATRMRNAKPKGNPGPRSQPKPLFLGNVPDPEPAPAPDHEPADAYPGTAERAAQLDAMEPKAAADAAWADVERARIFLNSAVTIQRQAISRLEAIQQEAANRPGEESRRRAQELSERNKHMYGR